MNPALTFAISTTPAETEIAELKQNVISYNISRAGLLEYIPLLLMLRDDAGKLMGGLQASIYFKWLYVDFLWIAESLRGQWQGSMLLRAAEEEARRRGCQHAWLNTFDFQARGFYEKHGYTLFGQLPDYPPGH